MEAILGSEAKASTGGAGGPESAETGTTLQTSTQKMKSPYIAGTVYP